MLEPGLDTSRHIPTHPDTSRHIQTTIPVARSQHISSKNCSHHQNISDEYRHLLISIVHICSFKSSFDQLNHVEPRFGPPGDCEVLRMVSDQDQPLLGDGALGRWRPAAEHHARRVSGRQRSTGKKAAHSDLYIYIYSAPRCQRHPKVSQVVSQVVSPGLNSPGYTT